MDQHSSREAAKKLGLHLGTLQRYIAEGRIPAPPLFHVGATKLRIWTEDDIERVRQALPKIANGRKTRYSKKRSAVSHPQSVKPKKKKTKK